MKSKFVPSSSFKFLQVVIPLIFFNFSVSFAQILEFPYPCPIEEGGWEYNLSSSTVPTKAFGKLSNQKKGDILSTKKEVQPYIDIDLGKSYKVNKIRLVSPTEARLKTYSIFVSSEKFSEKNKEGVSELPTNNVSAEKIITPPTFSSSDSVAFFPPLEGRYFRIQLNGDEPQSLVLSGLEFFGACGGSGLLQDPEESKCANGGFENGNFDGWVAESGGWRGHEIVMTRKGVDLFSSNHRLLKVPFVDEFNLPIGNPCKGNYVVKLGNSGVGNGAERLSYKFTVNPDNVNLFFRYAFVQQDAGHTARGQTNPYFWYKIIRVSDGFEIAEKLVQFNPRRPDPFFNKDARTQFLFRSWTCVNIDLSLHMGEECVAQFENADCNQDGHFGYTYIDGLCTSAQDNLPKTTLIGKTKICNDDEYIFSGANSCNGNRSIWTVSELHYKGFVTNTCTKEVLGNPGSINIKTFFNECYPFDVSKRYRVTLKVTSDCGEGQEEMLETEVVPKPFKYLDMIVCNNVTGEIKVKGLNTCGSCTSYQWSPSFAFVDPNVKDAILNPLFNKCNRTLRVRVIDENGCTFTDEIKLNSFDGNIVSVDTDVDKTDLNNGSDVPKSVYCGYEIKVNVNLGTCLQPDKIKVLITTEADPDYSGIAEFVSFNSNGLAVYRAIIPQSLGVYLHNTSNKLNASVFFTDYGNPQNNLAVFGDCNAKFPFTLENRFWYYGYWKNGSGNVGKSNFLRYNLNVNSSPSNQNHPGPAIFFPNLFSPFASDPNNKRWWAHSADGYGYGAFWYHIEVYNRWGNLVFIKEEKAQQPTIVLHNRFNDHSWINWDGKIDGQPIEIATLTWHINMETCVHPRRTTPILPSPVQDYLPIEWKGDVQIIR